MNRRRIATSEWRDRGIHVLDNESAWRVRSLDPSVLSPCCLPQAPSFSRSWILLNIPISHQSYLTEAGLQSLAPLIAPLVSLLVSSTRSTHPNRGSCYVVSVSLLPFFFFPLCHSVTFLCLSLCTYSLYRSPQSLCDSPFGSSPLRALSCKLVDPFIISL